MQERILIWADYLDEHSYPFIICLPIHGPKVATINLDFLDIMLQDVLSFTKLSSLEDT